MPDLIGVVVEVPQGLLELTGEAVYDEMERDAPRAFQPLVYQLDVDAPVASGRMRATGFRAVASRTDAGLIQGVTINVGSGVPYAHLPAFGHAIIPRGPGRKRRGKGRRAELRAQLNARRAAGAIGFVPGGGWVEAAVSSRMGEVTAEIERGLARSPLNGPAR